MSKIVLDTNCLVQCIPSRSKYRIIWNSILEGKNTLCVSNDILQEYEEILQKLAGLEIAKLVIDYLVTSPYVIFCNPYFNFNLIQNDADDNNFVDCAICANAKLIVTEDHHFDILKQCDFPRIPVMGLDDFKNFLQ